MTRLLTALAVALLAALCVASTASAVNRSAPRAHALDKYSALWHSCQKSPACAPGRNLRRHGVRFKWVSKDGERRHWGERPPTARDIAKRIKMMRYTLAVRALTPYPGPNGTWWAIPWYIVSCESGGDWTAANPSGAIGAYQLLGKGAPWPANTAAARLAHHRIAHKLWAGGAGAHHWVCA